MSLQSDFEKVTKVVQVNQFPVKVRLTKGMKGNYGWEVEVQAENYHEALFLIDTINRELQNKYGKKEKEGV